MNIINNNFYSPAFLGTKYVIGHKKPDTDSICSAIGYSALSENLKTDNDDKFIPLAAGDINKETEFALAYFNVQRPKVVTNLALSVSDIYNKKNIEELSLKPDSSIRELYNLMIKSNLEEMPVLDDKNKPIGMITAKDIVNFNLSKIDHLSSLKDKNITFDKLKTLLEAEVLSGDEYLNDTLEGNVKMGVYSCDTTKDIDYKNGMVLVGDRDDIQEEVINNGVKAIVITKNKKPSEKIKELAKEKNIIIFSTAHGTSTSAKLLEQSTPVSNIMSKDMLVFDESDSVDDIKAKAKNSNHQVFPVVNNGEFKGIITLDEILNPDENEVILVDHNAASQQADGIKRENIKEIIDHHKQEFISQDERIPITYSNTGATATLVAREFKANDIAIPEKIAGILWCAIVSDTDNFTSVTTTQQDIKMAKQLEKIAHIKNKDELVKKLLSQRDASLEGLDEKGLVDYDNKVFKNGNDFSYSIGQISSFDSQKYVDKKDDLISALNDFKKENNVGVSALMITDVPQKQSYFLCSSSVKDIAEKYLKAGDEEYLKSFFNGSTKTIKTVLNEIVKNSFAVLPNVMSRKEQTEPFLRKITEV